LDQAKDPLEELLEAELGFFVKETLSTFAGKLKM